MAFSSKWDRRGHRSSRWKAPWAGPLEAGASPRGPCSRPTPAGPQALRHVSAFADEITAIHTQPRSLIPRCRRAGPASLVTMGRHRGHSGSPGPGRSLSAATRGSSGVSPSWRMGVERQETLHAPCNLALSSGGGCGDCPHQHVLLVVTQRWMEGAAGDTRASRAQDGSKTWLLFSSVTHPDKRCEPSEPAWDIGVHWQGSPCVSCRQGTGQSRLSGRSLGLRE